MRYNQRFAIRLGFGLALFLLGAIAVFSYKTTQELVHATESVTQSHTTVETLDHLLARLKDVRFGVSAYITLHDRQALEAYYEAVLAMTYDVQRLKEFFRDDLETQPKLEGLQRLLDELAAESQEILTLEKTQGEEAATRQLQSNPQRQTINEITRVVWDLQYQEAKESRLRKEAATQSGKHTLFVIGIGNIFVILLSGLSLWLGHHERVARQKAEEQAVLAKEEAETANQAKSAFLATMSHEIRTPLNVIIGTADLLTETSLTQTQRAYMRIAQNAGHTLLMLINDILDFSKIEAGRITLESTTIDLEVLVSDVCEVLAVSAHQKGVELCYSIAADVPPFLRGDPTRLRQILVNLIGNAVKFTNQGEIVVEVQSVERERQKAESPEGPVFSQHRTSNTELQTLLQFSVRDTGIGIPLAQQQVIFDSFTQADSSTTRHFGGTGLGLTIVKRLVSLFGGEVWVDSQPGQGSTFSFTARFTVAIPLVIPPYLGTTLTNRTVLVLDANPTARSTIGAVLRQAGATVVEAATSAEGIVTLQRAPARGTEVALVLIACELLDEDGFTVACALKDDPAFSALKIAMLARVGNLDNLTRSQALGFPVVIKPTRRSQLLEVVIHTLTNSGMQNAPVIETLTSPQPLPVTNSQLLRVLLVEDDPHNRLLFQAYLAPGCSLLDVAENGKIAVAKFTTGAYDVVLMDIHMPEMDGFTATETIRAWEREHDHRETPILALTASAFDEDRQRIEGVGFTGYLPKPITKAALLAMLSTYRKGSGSVVHDIDIAEAPSVIVAIPHELRDLVPRYLEGQRETAVLLLFALEQQDYQTVQGLGHRLKGNGASFGFQKISDIGDALEVAAKERNTTALRKYQQELSAYLERVAVVYQ